MVLESSIQGIPSKGQYGNAKEQRRRLGYAGGVWISAMSYTVHQAMTLKTPKTTPAAPVTSQRALPPPTTALREAVFERPVVLSFTTPDVPAVLAAVDVVAAVVAVVDRGLGGWAAFSLNKAGVCAPVGFDARTAP